MRYNFRREHCSVWFQKLIKMTPNESKNFNSFNLRNLCLLFESFWSQKNSKRSKKIAIIFHLALEETFANFDSKIA